MLGIPRCLLLEWIVNMNDQNNFVSAAILDIQATIRALDVKVSALLVGILAPLANVGRVFWYLDHFRTQSPHWLFLLIFAIFLATWVLALLALVRAIGAVDNPAEHIINSNKQRGTFYSAGLYKLGLIDVFINRDIIKASKDPQSFAADLPKSDDEIELELVFEQMKLAYIRDIKLKRLCWGQRFAFIWFTLGIFIFLYSKYWIGQ